ncbi:MAG: radical SAM protein [Anaerolineae bacterium]
MKKRLLLINPAHVVDGRRRSGPAQFAIPPLSLAYIAALTPSNWTVRIIDENLRVESGVDWRPDLVGITALTPSAPRAYALAARHRAQGARVVLGGVHPSALPSEAVKYTDAVVVGEAEPVWHQVIADFEAGRLLRHYEGDRLPLDGLPIPRRDLYPGSYFIEMLLTSKGCTNACDFCSVWQFYGRRYRVRPIEEVVDELEQLRPRKLVFLADDNFTLNRNRVIALCKRMVERRVCHRYAIQATARVGEDDELLKWLKRSGCRFILMGLESLSEQSLATIGKPDLLATDVAGLRERIARIHAHGIAVYGSFIIGLDGDTTTFQQLRTFTLTSEIDCTLVNILNPLPGTPLWDRLRAEGRLLFTAFPDDYARYAQDSVCFRPSEMSSTDLQKGTRSLIASLTRLPVALRRATATWRHTRDPFTVLMAFVWNWRTHRALRTFPIRDMPSPRGEFQVLVGPSGSW